MQGVWNSGQSRSIAVLMITISKVEKFFVRGCVKCPLALPYPFCMPCLLPACILGIYVLFGPVFSQHKCSFNTFARLREATPFTLDWYIRDFMPCSPFPSLWIGLFDRRRSVFVYLPPNLLLVRSPSSKAKQSSLSLRCKFSRCLRWDPLCRARAHLRSVWEGKRWTMDVQWGLVVLMLLGREARSLNKANSYLPSQLEANSYLHLRLVD